MSVPAVPESEGRKPGGIVPGPVEFEALTLPHTGEIIDLADTAACAFALNELRSLEARMYNVKAILTDAIVAESKRQGSKTLHMGVIDAEVRGGSETEWDAESLAEMLLQAGLPQERVSEVVKETVTYKVDAREARRVAAANPEYSMIVDACQSVVEKKPYIVVRRA